MNRKEFVSNLLAAAPLLYAPSLLLSSCRKDKPDPNGKRVLILGAGVAGLAAGRKLRDQGFEVVVIEARDRVGGRVSTDRSGGLIFDQGASWLHGPNGNPLKSLLEEAGATTYVTDDESLRVYERNGSLIPDSVADPAYDDYEDALKAVAAAGSRNQSFATVFDALYPGRSASDLWQYMLSAYLEFDAAGDIARLSSLYFEDDEAFNGKDRIVTNGYDLLPQFLARDLDIRLGTVATRVDYSGGTVTVTTDQGEFSGDYAVVTLPLGVLKDGDLAFQPALPNNKLDALDQLGIGAVNKFLFSWASPFWDTGLQYFGYTAAEKGKFNYFLNLRTYSSLNGLMTFGFGDYGLQTESMTDQEVQDGVMAHLRSIFGNGIPDPLQMRRSRWVSDPFAKGAYSYVAAGGESAAYDVLAAGLEGRLFFAGEHTSRDYRGTVHGAFLSGEREANKIIDLL